MNEDSSGFTPSGSTAEIIQLILDTLFLEGERDLGNGIQGDIVVLVSEVFWDIGIDDGLHVVDGEDILGLLG